MRKTSAEYQRDYRKRHPERCVASAARYYLKRRNSLYALKQGPCKDCREIYPPYVMQFDHVDPATKKFNIGDHLNAPEALEEARKCEVVCANCHAERTWQRKHGNRRWKELEP